MKPLQIIAQELLNEPEIIEQLRDFTFEYNDKRIEITVMTDTTSYISSHEKWVSKTVICIMDFDAQLEIHAVALSNRENPKDLLTHKIDYADPDFIAKIVSVIQHIYLRTDYGRATHHKISRKL